MVENYIDAFKEYVPAEILAAFIAIHTFLRYQAPLDIYLIILTIAVCMVYFVLVSVRQKRIRSKAAIGAVALCIPLWCMMIAIDRFDNYFPAEDIKQIVMVVLVLSSLGLTLFGPRTKHDEKPA